MTSIAKKKLYKIMVASAAILLLVISSVHCFATHATLIGRPAFTMTTAAPIIPTLTMTASSAQPPPLQPQQEQQQVATFRNVPFVVESTSPMIAKPFLLSAQIRMGIPPSKSLRHQLLGVAPDQSKALPASSSTNRPRIVGHRGALYQELENTLPAFRACVGSCNAVELDVFELPKDKTLIVFHGSGNDENPGLLENYITNAPANAKSILDLTYEQTQQLKFNPHFAELGAPGSKIVTGRIPTLEQVLIDLQPTGMEIKIELKGPGVAKPVVKLVDRLGMADQCSFSSFDHGAIATVRALRPQRDPRTGQYLYRTGALFNDLPDDFVQQAQAVGASEVHVRYDTCTKRVVQRIHQAHMGSMAWMRGPIGMTRDVADKYWDIGNEDERCYQALVDTGVQQLCVNRPDVLHQLLTRKPTKTLLPLMADNISASNQQLLHEQPSSTAYVRAM